MKQIATLLLVVLCAMTPAFGQSVERTALIALCDPAKIATLQSERAANPRIRKIAHWLEVARLNGNSPDAEMAATKRIGDVKSPAAHAPSRQHP